VQLITFNEDLVVWYTVFYAWK